MALEGVPWMIGGGQALHTADVGRSLAYMASNGETGVTTATDLAVTALTVPGAAVSIAPGSGPVLNTYPGAAGQSYVVRAPSATQLAIPATGGSAATRYVIIRISDPQYGGQVPADPANGPYVVADVVSSLSLPYPFLPLAKITQPANTATITQAMIADLRKVANPRQRTEFFTEANDGSANFTLSSTAQEGQHFPTSFKPQTTIPSWATYMQIRVTWSGVLAQAATGNGSALLGLGPTGAETLTEHFSWSAGDGAAVTGRNTWVAAKAYAIPKAWRGGPLVILPRARWSVRGTGNVKIDSFGAMTAEVVFSESAAIS